jgi:hypothetical protein
VKTAFFNGLLGAFPNCQRFQVNEVIQILLVEPRQRATGALADVQLPILALVAGQQRPLAGPLVLQRQHQRFAAVNPEGLAGRDANQPNLSGSGRLPATRPHEQRDSGRE